MHSIVTNDGEYIGQYLNIKDSEFAINMFAKFYNFISKAKSTGIILDKKNIKDIIHSSKYTRGFNKIYVNDPNTENIILKSVNVGDFMVFIQKTTSLYILNKSEFKNFMNSNNYNKDVSNTYVLGIDNGVKFDNMHIIASNNLENAKLIYKERYDHNPICIGVIENDRLYILSDKRVFNVPLSI